MKKIIFIILIGLISFFNCSNNEPECKVGEWRCNGSMEQICNANEEWENYHDCNIDGERCSTDPNNCSGYYGIVCCY